MSLPWGEITTKAAATTGCSACRPTLVGDGDTRERPALILFLTELESRSDYR